MIYNENTLLTMNRREFLHLIIYLQQPTANIIFNGEILKVLPKVSNKTTISALAIAIQNCTGGPIQCNKEERDKKGKN